MKRLNTYLRGFRDEDKGSIAVETIIIIPILFWTYLSMFAIFDAYRQHAINTKAAYTLADVISRETNGLDTDYLNGTREMLAYLTVNTSDDVSVRVTSVKYNATDDKYERDWSEANGWVSPLSNSDVQGLRDSLPVMPDNERVVVVETFVKYDPPFDTGLELHNIHNFVFTRPRYAPQVLWVGN